MTKLDPYSDETYKARIYDLLSQKEHTRTEIIRALGAKIRADQLTRVLESLVTDGKISQRKHYGNYGSTYAPRWGLIDHPNQVAEREEEERRQLALQKVREGYLARARAEERKANWHSYKEDFMVQNDPKDFELLVRRIFSRTHHKPTRRAQVAAPWKHSTDLF